MSADGSRLVALIPARAASKRLPGKNLLMLAGHPLVTWAIATAREAGIFAEVCVSSDDDEILKQAAASGACPIKRPEAYARDHSPDILWVNHVMMELRPRADAFAILRPTSPFRRGEWVRAAWEALEGEHRADSLRALRPAAEHPGKMWRRRLASPIVTPLLPFTAQSAPWHSMPTQELPGVWVQTAALEIARTRVLPASISGDVVLGWETRADAPCALDINTLADYVRAVELARDDPDALPWKGLA